MSSRTRQCQSLARSVRHELRHRISQPALIMQRLAAHKRWSSSVFLASNSDSVMAPASSSFLSFMIPSWLGTGLPRVSVRVRVRVSLRVRVGLGSGLFLELHDPFLVGVRARGRCEG